MKELPNRLQQANKFTQSNKQKKNFMLKEGKYNYYIYIQTSIFVFVNVLLIIIDTKTGNK